jgi:rRNA processing protein Gar1
VEKTWLYKYIFIQFIDTQRKKANKERRRRRRKKDFIREIKIVGCLDEPYQAIKQQSKGKKKIKKNKKIN